MKYPIELKLQAVELYKAGHLGKEIANMLNVPKTTIGNWMRDFGVARHRGIKSKIGREDYFDTIDTEDKAYWLGWIMADGNVSITNKQYSLKLHISLEDKELIDGFLTWIESDNKTKEKEVSYYVSLSSKHMVQSLMKLGVIPQKTGKESLPDISKEMMPHFIRGFFDGDGITCDKKNKRSGFVGSFDIVNSIMNELGVSYKICAAEGAYYFLGGREFSRKLYEYMYSDATLWLNRKRNKMDTICGNTEVTSRINKLLAP